MNSWRKRFEPVPGFPELFWPCAGERHHQAPCGMDVRNGDDHDWFVQYTFSGRLPLFVNCLPWTSFLNIVLDSKSLFAETALLKVCDITQFLCSLLEVCNKNLHLKLVSRYQLKMIQFLWTSSWKFGACTWKFGTSTWKFGTCTCTWNLPAVCRYQLRVSQFLWTCTWNLQAGMEVTSAVTIVFTPSSRERMERSSGNIASWLLT